MKLKLFFFNAFFIITSTALFSQNTVNEKWQLISTDKNVSVYYETGTCRNTDVVFLKIINNNSQTATIDWSLWDNSTSKKVQVKANETIAGACVNRMPMYTLTESIPSGKSQKDLHAVIKVQLEK